MRLKRQDLRKIIIETLLKEVDDENLRGPRTVAPLASLLLNFLMILKK